MNLDLWGFEGVLLGCSPFELLVLLGQKGEGLDDARETFDKPTVVVSKSHEGLYVWEFLGDRPVSNPVDLFGVHLEAIRGDYDAEVLCGCFIKFSFLGFYLKACPL